MFSFCGVLIGIQARAALPLYCPRLTPLTWVAAVGSRATFTKTFMSGNLSHCRGGGGAAPSGRRISTCETQQTCHGVTWKPNPLFAKCGAKDPSHSYESCFAPSPTHSCSQTSPDGVYSGSGVIALNPLKVTSVDLVRHGMGSPGRGPVI